MTNELSNNFIYLCPSTFMFNDAKCKYSYTAKNQRSWHWHSPTSNFRVNAPNTDIFINSVTRYDETKLTYLFHILST